MIRSLASTVALGLLYGLPNSFAFSGERIDPAKEKARARGSRKRRAKRAKKRRMAKESRK